ncbi:hypothetical protein FPHOBKDP_00091 [Listeria phage LPJP1]|nr:hypothetical protein FPHOBKDP_00091 [Listeria phage LPJP1]
MKNIIKKFMNEFNYILLMEQSLLILLGLLSLSTGISFNIAESSVLLTSETYIMLNRVFPIIIWSYIFVVTGSLLIISAFISYKKPSRYIIIAISCFFATIAWIIYASAVNDTNTLIKSNFNRLLIISVFNGMATITGGVRFWQITQKKN